VSVPQNVAFNATRAADRDLASLGIFPEQQNCNLFLRRRRARRPRIFDNGDYAKTFIHFFYLVVFDFIFI
jgi:hypothetical protein